MGLLDDAIREHLELKRRRGADPSEVERMEQEALGGPTQRGEFVEPAPPPPDEEPAVYDERADDEPPPPEPEQAGEPWLDEPAAEPVDEPEPEPMQPTREFAPDEAPERDDVLEETPEFLQETPEHDRLWFEQKPPRDFDLDR